jgi:autotransporter-associated beta strand protein
MKKRFPSFVLAAICAGLLCQAPLQAQFYPTWTYTCFDDTIQTWNAPRAGNYSITARGGQGGFALLGDPVNTGVGGAGAVVGGTFQLSAAMNLQILVGSYGCGGVQSDDTINIYGGGGGGGTYVVDSSNNSPLVVAGGGGGGYLTVTTQYNGLNASLTTAGGNSPGGGSGGINGSGGSIGVNTPTSGGAGGGGFIAGSNGNGGTHYSGNGQTRYAAGGDSFLNGGWGGASIQYVGQGGWGGGGGGGGSGSLNGTAGGGGGGGYSGGGGGNGNGGGGGGSYISSNATNTSMSLAQIYTWESPNNNGQVQIILLDASGETWTGGAGNGNWTDSANWNIPYVTDSVVYFAGSNQTDVDTDTNQSVIGIVFDAGASPFTISNNTITLAGNVINQSSANQTIYSLITLATNANFIAESGNLVFGGVSFGANTTSLTVNGSNDTLINNTISGNGSLLKSGAGTLTLSGHNTFKGNITISDGNLAILGGSAVPDGVAVTLSSANATLTIGTSETIDSLQGVGTTAINANQILTINQVGNTSYSGSITGLGELKIAGAGTLTLSGSSTYGGGTTLITGTLVLAGASSAGSGDIDQKFGETNLLQIDTTGTITNNMIAPNLLATQNATLSGEMWSFGTSTWNVQTGVTLTASGSLAGMPTLTKTGNGTLVLNGNTPPVME